MQIMVISVGFLLKLAGKALLQKNEKPSVPEAGSCYSGSLEGETLTSSLALDIVYYNSNLLRKRGLLTQ